MRWMCCLLLLYAASLDAQQVYWVEFTQKDSSFSLSQPETFLSGKALQRRKKYQIPVTVSDLPVSPAFSLAIGQKGYTVLSVSRWLNAAAVLVPGKADESNLTAFPFVRKITPLGKYETPIVTHKRPIDRVSIKKMQDAGHTAVRKNADSMNYGKSAGQVRMLNVQELHKLGYKGEGVNIAVIDAGFNNADTVPAFWQLLVDKRVKATRDFVQHNAEVFEDDDHGLAVLSCMAGYLPGEYIGTAPMANYYLLRSEYARTEMPVEEAYWIAAIEYADSAGADLVNSSLGYNEFDDIAYSYSYKDMDGKTAIISRAAAMAVQKGLVVLVSAGNEGDEDWKYITVPGDVAEVITVGGVDADSRLARFSSIGPTADKRIKPDIMAQADNVWVASTRGAFYQGDGTSYSCPLMTGSVACLMQACPWASPQQIMQVLHTSGSQYDQPDAYFGYGIPDMHLAYLMLQRDTADELLDVRVLDNNRVHVACRIKNVQKADVTITGEEGKVLLHESLNLKKTGINRFPLKKIKHFKKGTYTLQFSAKGNVFKYSFNYE